MTPNVGDYALYYGWSKAEIAQVEKVTAKQVKLKDSWRGRTKRRDEIVAAFPDAESAQKLRDALNGAIGQREERIRKARQDFEERKAAAFEAFEKVEARLLASGMSASGQDREAGLEAKPASPVGEAETPKGHLQTPPGPNKIEKEE